MAKMLLDQPDISLEVLNEDGNSVLHFLVRLNDPDISDLQVELIQGILKKRFNVNSTNNLKETPLHCCCMYGSLAAATALIEDGKPDISPSTL